MTYLRLVATALGLGVALTAAWPGRWAKGSEESAAAEPAPDVGGATGWLNSQPLLLRALRGKVVLVEFWTRECINCLHVIPHTRELYERYRQDGLVVIGVHTPEYEEERDPAGVAAAARGLDIGWPVAIDNDHRIWNAYSNRYWPALYLIDRNGRIVYRHVGEGGYAATEEQVRRLLGKS